MRHLPSITNSRDLVYLPPPLKRAALFLLVFSAASNVLLLTGPLFMFQVYDRVLTSGSVSTLVALMVIVTGLYGAMALIDWIRARVLARIARSWDENIAVRVFNASLAKGHELPLFTRVYSPLRDLDAVRNFLMGTGPLALCDLPWVPINIAIIFLLHNLLGWFSILALVVLVLLMIGGQSATKKRLGESIGCSEAAHLLEQEARSKSEYVRALSLDNGLSDRWSNLHKTAVEMQQSTNDRGSMFSSMTKASRLLFQSGILAVGAWLAIHQEISAGTIIAAGIILGRGLAPVEHLLGHWRSLGSALAGWRRLQQISDFLMDPVGKTELSAPEGPLTVTNVTCFAPGVPRPILSQVEFQLNAGEVLGILGPTGAGKSTLIKAIIGITPMARGEVRLNGAKLDQWDRRQLGRYLGYLPQDCPLITGTVAENISRFSPESTSAQIVDAAKLVHAHDMILALPNGYDTVVGPRGMNVSSGERQRIALASAFFNRPHLIVLDEPDAFLDEIGNRALLSAIKTMRSFGALILIATQRTSTLAEIDKALILNKGIQVALNTRTQAPALASGGRVSVVHGGAGT